MSLFEKIGNDIQIAHLNQLKTFSAVAEKLPKPPVYELPISRKQMILNWIDEQEKKGRIGKAKGNRVTTPKDQNTPDWNSAIFAVIESAAMYLRRDEDMQKAIQAVQEGDDISAISFLLAAQADIDEIAERLGLKFLQLCDMAEIPGTNAYSGAFCGIFVSDSDDCKFVGVAFKGTTPTNTEEWKEDLWVKVLEAQAPVLYGTKVHSGFYYGLFDTFRQNGHTVQPFALIMRGLLQYDDSYYVHVTGHSLGAAYATLLHCELNRLAGDPQATKAILKDLMNFGSPRVGQMDFANKCGENMRPGQKSWRFANYLDPVTMVPPRFLMEYIHVDIGYTLYDDGEFEPIPNERNYPLTDAAEDQNAAPTPHDIVAYYEYIDNISS